MKNHLPGFIPAALLGLALCVSGTSTSFAQSQDLDLQEDTFIRVPALEFTVATVSLDKYFASVPLDFTRTERAFSQIRTGVNYDQGMVWLTFKSGGNRSVLSQIRNFRITKKVRSSWRLSSAPSWQAQRRSASRQARKAAVVPAIPMPAPKPLFLVPSEKTSAMTLTEIAPGVLTVSRGSDLS